MLVFISNVFKGIFTLLGSHSKVAAMSIDKKRGRQAALIFSFQHFLDRCSFEKRPERKKLTKAQHTFAMALFPRSSKGLDLWEKLFEPAVTVSGDQQMAKHEHDRMAVGNQDIEKSQVRHKG